MAEEKVVNEQEMSAEEVKQEQATAQEEAAKKDHKHDKKSKKDKSDEAQEQIEKLQNELADMKDKHVRLQAEFDNFRKRTMKEKMESYNFV